MTGVWITAHETEDGRFKVQHLDGVEWNKAPIPPRLHRCKPQTWGRTNYFTEVYRCACGGFAFVEPKPFWLDKNSRRKVKV